MNNEVFKNKDNIEILIKKTKDLRPLPFWWIGFEEENYREVKIGTKEGKIKDPIIITSSGLILDGHHRWKAATDLGITEVFCRKLPRNVIEIFKIGVIAVRRGSKRIIPKLIGLIRKIFHR